MEKRICADCGERILDQGSLRPVWRGVTLILPFELCAGCCVKLLEQLNANPDLRELADDMQAMAQLAACEVVGSA